MSKRELKALIENMDAEIGELREREDFWHAMFSAVNKDLGESMLELLQANQALADMTEARDAVSAASKFLRDRCDMQADILTMIAKHGAQYPGWAVRLAKAAIEGEK